MGMGDVATWAGVATSVVFSSAALVVSIVSARHARRSADAAERQAIAAEKALPPSPPDVAWRIEYAKEDKYVLRNVGVNPASGVKIHFELILASAHIDQPSDRPIPPNGSLSFHLMGAMYAPLPDELLVSWDGNPEGVLVPVPPGEWG